MNTPSISVIMSVHNGAKFLSEAVESILGQTYTDFEFIIVDDASIDESVQILADFAAADKRIILLRNESKRGLAASLNLALAAAAPLVVRMDADDISLPGRLALQKKLMDEHPEVAVLGGGVRFLDNYGVETGEWILSGTSEEIKDNLLEYGPPFAHSSVIMRKEALLDVGGYREIFPCAQDYDLWLRMAERFSLATHSEVILCYRQHPGAVSKSKNVLQLCCMALARLASQRRRLGLPDILLERTDPITIDFALTFIDKYSYRTLLQFFSLLCLNHSDTNSELLIKICTRIFQTLPLGISEERFFAYAYKVMLRECPKILHFVGNLWSQSDFVEIYRTALVQHAPHCPLPPFALLDKALGGYEVPGHLLVRELAVYACAPNNKHAWVHALISRILETKGIAEFDWEWISARSGAISLLLREAIGVRLEERFFPGIDLSDVGPTTSLELLCRLGYLIHELESFATEVGLDRLRDWLEAESCALRGRDALFLSHIVEQFPSKDTLRDKFATVEIQESPLVSIVICAKEATPWLEYMVSTLEYEDKVELILNDESEDFWAYSYNSMLQKKVNVCVISSSKMYNAYDEALAMCKGDVIAFAKDYFCYDLNSIKNAKKHLNFIDAVFGYPHFAKDVPKINSNKILESHISSEVMHYFPLFILRKTIDKLGFFKIADKKKSEQGYYSNLCRLGFRVRCAKDVLIPNGNRSLEEIFLQRAIRQRAKKFLKRIRSFFSASNEKNALLNCSDIPTEVSTSACVKVPIRPAILQPSLFQTMTIAEWFAILPQERTRVMVSPGVALALLRDGGGHPLFDKIVEPGMCPDPGELFIVFASEAKNWRTDVLEKCCTVLCYAGAPDEVYVNRGLAYDVADMVVGMTPESYERLAVFHPVSCLAENIISCVQYSVRLFSAYKHNLRLMPSQFQALASAVIPQKSILLSVDTFLQGGRENIILALMSHLRDFGYKVHLNVSGRLSDEAATVLKNLGMPYTTVASEPGHEQEFLKNQNVGLVVAQHCRDFAKSSFELGIPYIQSVYGMFMSSSSEELMSWRSHEQYTSAYVCVSPLSAMEVDRHFGVAMNKVVVMPCASAMHLDSDWQPERDIDLRAEFGIPEDSPVFLCLGRLQDAKGQRLLLDAFYLAHRKNPAIRLVLCGPCFDDTYRQSLLKQIEKYNLADSVILAGMRDDVPRLFNLSKGLVMPSFTEGWSLAIAEAVSIGVPVVATNVGGALEQLRGTNGILLQAFAGDLWNVSRDHFSYATTHEHQQHELRDDLCAAMLRIADLPIRERACVSETVPGIIKAMCERYIALYLAVLNGNAVTGVRHLAYFQQKQMRYLDCN